MESKVTGKSNIRKSFGHVLLMSCKQASDKFAAIPKRGVSRKSWYCLYDVDKKKYGNCKMLQIQMSKSKNKYQTVHDVTNLRRSMLLLTYAKFAKSVFFGESCILMFPSDSKKKKDVLSGTPTQKLPSVALRLSFALIQYPPRRENGQKRLN